MCKENVNNEVKGLGKNLNWNSAIADAEQMIREFKATISSLKASIRVFERRRDEGEPFPDPSNRDGTRRKSTESRRL